ncbi:hypothetical protein Sjap_001792 [Stephania japonica]|uniref:Squalene cyclase C-terminal domain-containing protein n=1 Tax=Stephania japonica TaxID=461633 RepID=A0AAP0PS12_9MAGN
MENALLRPLVSGPKTILANEIRYGSWAVCFTYATWFGMKALVARAKTFENSSRVRKACEFLLKKQLASEGWGESYLSCQDKRPIHRGPAVAPPMRVFFSEQ